MSEEIEGYTADVELVPENWPVPPSVTILLEPPVPEPLPLKSAWKTRPAETVWATVATTSNRIFGSIWRRGLGFGEKNVSLEV